MKHKTLLRVLVPVLILALVGGLWLMKNSQRAAESARQMALAKDNPVYLLEDTAVDLPLYQAQGLPIIMDFGAEDCPPCQEMRPALEQAHEDNLGRATIKFFDVWKRPELTGSYPIAVIPSQVLMHPDGRPYQPSEEVLQKGLNFEFYDDISTKEHALTVHVGILDAADFELILQDMGA